MQNTQIKPKISSINIILIFSKSRLQLWDSAAGSLESYIQQMLFRNSALGVGVVDLTDKNSQQVILKWIDIFKQYSPNVPIIIIGNKSDRRDRIVTKDEMRKVFQEYKYIDFSCKYNNITELFTFFMKIIIHNESMTVLHN